MLPVQLQPLHHRGEEHIAIRFSHHPELTQKVKTLPNVRCSRTHQCWYVPLAQPHYLEIRQRLSSLAIIDARSLCQYLHQRKAVQPLTAGDKPLSCKRSLLLQTAPLSEPNLQAFALFQQKLQLKGYSKNTFRTYCTEFHYLLRQLGNVPVSTLSKPKLESYLLWLLTKQRYSEVHLHTAINALKFYFEQVEGRGKEFYDIPRPKKPLRLPPILAEEEVVALVKGTNNLKHRALLMTAYGAGLRVSEMVNLKLRDIDSKRMMIFVEQSKGKKDRLVPLSKRLLETLRAYIEAFRPKVYLFEGEEGGAYSTRSAQDVLKEAKERAGIL